jgi:hypothetical protein
MKPAPLASAFATALVALVSAPPVASAGVHLTSFSNDAVLTRYGTSHETVNVLSMEPTLEVGLTRRLAAFGKLPLASTFVHKNACCGYGLGNVTTGLRYRLEEEVVETDLLVSASLPTAEESGLSRFASTAALTRDAGLYQPGITTLRLGVAARAPIGRAFVGGAAAAHAWMAGGANAAYENRIVLPLEASAGYRLSSRLAAIAAYATVASPGQPKEAFLHAASFGIAYAGPRVAFGTRVHLPLDGSFRRQGMIGIGTNVVAAF